MFLIFYAFLCLSNATIIHINKAVPSGIWLEYFSFDSHAGFPENFPPYILMVPNYFYSRNAWIKIDTNYPKLLSFNVSEYKNYIKMNFTWISPEWKLGIGFSD
jgi:hypothetical protein